MDKHIPYRHSLHSLGDNPKCACRDRGDEISKANLTVLSDRDFWGVQQLGPTKHVYTTCKYTPGPKEMGTPKSIAPSCLADFFLVQRGYGVAPSTQVFGKLLPFLVMASKVGHCVF